VKIFHWFDMWRARNTGDDGRSGSSDEDAKGALRFSDVVIFYNYVFDLGIHLDPLEAGRRILKTDLGLAAFGLGEDDVLVADRFEELQGLLRKVHRLEDDLEHMGQSSLRALALLALHHPFALLRGVRRSRRPRRGADTDPELASAGDNDAATDDTRSSLEETRRLIEESMARVQLFGLLRRHVDRELFRPDYLAGLPFARMDLQPVFMTMGEQELSVDVGLLIHRTGIAILTFYVMFDKTFDVDELIRMSTAAQLRFTETEVARALVDVQARSFSLGRREVDSFPTSREHRDGIEWFRYRHVEPVGLFDLFEMYASAAQAAVHQRTPTRPDETWEWARTGEWLAYPVVFLRRAHGVPPGERIKDAFPLATAGLIMRYPSWRDLDTDVAKRVLDEDASILTTSSWWALENATTVLYEASHRLEADATSEGRPAGNDWIVQEFRASSAVEPLLVQLWILRALSARLRETPGQLGQLLRLKAELVVGLEELQGLSTFMFGSLRETTERARVRFGVKAAHEALVAELQLVDQIISVQEAQRRAARGRFATLAGTTVGLILGAAGARQLVLTLASFQQVSERKWGSAVAGPANWAINSAHNHPALSIAVLWLAVAVIFAVLLVLTVLPIRSERAPHQQVLPKPRPVRGYTWPGVRPVVVSGPEAGPGPSQPSAPVADSVPDEPGSG